MDCVEDCTYAFILFFLHSSPKESEKLSPSLPFRDSDVQTSRISAFSWRESQSGLLSDILDNRLPSLKTMRKRALWPQTHTLDGKPVIKPAGEERERGHLRARRTRMRGQLPKHSSHHRTAMPFGLMAFANPDLVPL